MPEPSEPNETGKTLAVFERGIGNQVRAVWDCYRGHRFLRLAVWYLPDEGGEWKPTRKGVTIRPGELRQLQEALDLALAEAELAEDEDEESGTE
jgi:hypothetical protein